MSYPFCFFSSSSPQSYILLVYLCLPAAVPYLSKGQSITLLYCRSPSFLTPHSSIIRSFSVFSFSLSHCQLQGYHITSASFLSVCYISPSVCLRLSFCFSVTKDGYLHTLAFC